MTTDFIIIGGGPAGCSAALFAAKAKRKAVLIHKGTTSLLPTLRWLLPGFPEGTGAAEWMQNLKTQIDAIPFETLPEEVTQAALGASVKQIITSSGKTLEAPVIILATGCYNRIGFIEGEARFAGHGVFYNAYQDANLFEGETVVVEGKTDQAAREVLHLARFANKIHFVVPAMKLEIDEKLANHLRDNDKIEVSLSASIKKIDGNTQLESATILIAGEEKQIPTRGVFLYARQSKPQYEFLKGTIEISDDGAVLVDDQLMTSIPGVFACGDMLAGVPQLQFVSAAQGLVAAMNADRYLSNTNL